MDGPESAALPGRALNEAPADDRAGQGAARVVRQLLLGQAALACVPAILLLAPPAAGIAAFLAEARRSGVAAIALAASLIALAGLCGTWIMAKARAGVTTGRTRSLTPHRPHPDEDAAIGRAARWPQAVMVTLPAVAGCALAWLMRPASGIGLPSPSLCYALGASAIVLAFPLLIMERVAAGLSPARLPEAAALRALLTVPVLAWTIAGVLEIAAGLGAPILAARLGDGVALLVAAVGLELALRALGRLFLPPPDAPAARAAATSSLASALAQGGTVRGGVAEPLRQHFGLDFSRSWALAYARAAVLPLALVLALLAWGMSGLVLIGPDERAVYERLGAPAAVLHPGLHAMLPWPLGRARRLDYGPVHSVSLVTPGDAQGDGARPDRTEAEAPAPRSADRLWEQAHPAEIAFLIASQGGDGRQLFQTVSADMRVLYRIGLTDADALRAAYAVADPEAFVRAAAGRVAAGFFAGRTLDAVLGENREAMAEHMRIAVQGALDGTGVEVVAVVIEAIHPPAGAAQAYHAVQAAEIQATASVAAEQGRALAARASAAQYAADLVNQARAAAAEATGEASATLTRFTADREAAHSGGDAFLLERYLAGLTAALPKLPLLILDNRLDVPDAPVLDLRPPAGPAGAPGAAPGTE